MNISSLESSDFKYHSVVQVPYQSATNPEGEARVRRAQHPHRADLQLDRAETDEGIREGARVAQHGRHRHRPHDAHARQLPLITGTLYTPLNKQIIKYTYVYTYEGIPATISTI